MEMKLTRLRCTNCGRNLEIEDLKPDQEFIKCTSLGCGATFRIDRGLKFADIQQAEAEKIGKYRREMMEALSPLNRTQAAVNAENILKMIPDDFRAKAVLSITSSWFEDQRPLEDFLKAQNECTTEEFEEIFPAILNQCNYKAWQHLVESIPNYISDPQKQAEMKEQADLRMESILEENDKYAIVSRDIFICHSSSDGGTVMRVLDALESDGWKCWISERNMPPDTRLYWEKIKKNIGLCKIFLVCCSGNAMLSNPVQRELAMAEEFPVERLELKLDSRKHTTLFNHFFEGITWIPLEENFEASMTNLKNTVYQILHKKSLEEIFAIAEKYAKEGDYKKELETLHGAEKDYPQNISVILNIGRAYRHNGDYTNALNYYEKAAVLNPDEPAIYISRGALYIILCQYSIAKEQYEIAENLLKSGRGQVSPNDLSILYANYALATGKLGQRQTAENYLNHALELGYPPETANKIREQIGIVPEDLQAQNAYNSAVKLMSDGTLDSYLQAIQILEPILKYKDSEALLLQCRSKINEIGSQKDAVYNEAIKLMQDKTTESYKKALVLLQQLSGWKLSENLIKDCRAGITENENKEIYDNALEYISIGTRSNLLEAEKLLKQIPKYKDSEIQLRKIHEKLDELNEIQQKDNIYAKALEAARSGTREGYREAIDLLISIRGWKDADNLVAEYQSILDRSKDVKAFWLFSLAAGILFVLPRFWGGTWLDAIMHGFIYFAAVIADFHILLTGCNRPHYVVSILMLLPIAAKMSYSFTNGSEIVNRIMIISEIIALFIALLVGVKDRPRSDSNL